MQRPLFVGGGRRCHSLSELRDLYACGAAGERAALLEELGAQYRAGRLALWLRSCLREGVRSKRVTFAKAGARRTSDALRTWMDARRAKAWRLLGSAEAPALPLTFDVLREGVLDADADGVLLEELLRELVGADVPAAPSAKTAEPAIANTSADAGIGPAAACALAVADDAGSGGTPASPSAAKMLGASPVYAGSHEQKRRRECARFPWYEGDGLADLADWSRVACSDDELQQILAAIAYTRATRAEQDPGVATLEVAEIHLCHVADGEFDLGSGRFSQTRFVCHGNPELIVGDSLAVQMAGAVACIPGTVEGTSYIGAYRFVVQRPA